QECLVLVVRHLLAGGGQQLRDAVDYRVTALQAWVVEGLGSRRPVGHEKVQRALVQWAGQDPQQRVVGVHGVNSLAPMGGCCCAVSCLGMISRTETASTVPARRSARRRGS